MSDFVCVRGEFQKEDEGILIFLLFFLFSRISHATQPEHSFLVVGGHGEIWRAIIHYTTSSIFFFPFLGAIYLPILSYFPSSFCLFFFTHLHDNVFFFLA